MNCGVIGLLALLMPAFLIHPSYNFLLIILIEVFFGLFPLINKTGALTIVSAKELTRIKSNLKTLRAKGVREEAITELETEIELLEQRRRLAELH